MRNNCLSLTELVLELLPRRNSPWQSLHCQHWRHEATTLWAVGKQQGSKAFQRLCRPSGGLERYQGSAPVSRTPIHLSNHLFQGDKSLPRWFPCRAFWYWQDKGVGWPEILLVKPEERRRKLCLGMQRLSSFKNHPPQALWRPAVFAYINLSMKRPLHRLCDRLTVIRGLEGRQLRLNPRHCQPVD